MLRTLAFATKALIDPLSVIKHNDADLGGRIIDLVYDPQIPDPNFVCVDTGEFLRPEDAWINLKLPEMLDYFVVCS